MPDLRNPEIFLGQCLAAAGAGFGPMHAVSPDVVAYCSEWINSRASLLTADNCDRLILALPAAFTSARQGPCLDVETVKRAQVFLEASETPLCTPPPPDA